MSTGRPPIIIKKKAGHGGGHHGGAWKVAYADFVTAMMALFIVLWLMSSSKEVKNAVAGYFNDPKGTGKLLGTTLSGTGEKVQLSKEDMSHLKEELQKSIEHVTNFEKLKNQIELTVTAEGLRIELLESEAGTFFDSGSPEPSANGRELLATLAQEIAKLPNRISIEGHTDSKPYSSGGNYSNWELSTDRANAARRLMQEYGMRADQVSQVRGYADQSLRNKENPMDAANRRISLIVQYLEDPKKAPAPVPPGTQAAAEHAGKPEANAPAAAPEGKNTSEAKPAEHH